MKVLLATTRNWHLGHTAQALSNRAALASLWMADKKPAGLPSQRFSRCWPYHLAMKPFYHCAPQIWDEKATYRLLPLYKAWLALKLRSTTFSDVSVVHGIVGFATELFNAEVFKGALK